MAARAHSGLEFELVGSKQLQLAMLAFALRAPEAAGRALEAEADIELEAAKFVTPLGETGKLRESATRHPAVITDDEVSVRMSFGGPDVPYAVIQHEKLQYEHDDGEAKYLENTLRASRVYLLPRLGRRLGVELTKKT